MLVISVVVLVVAEITPKALFGNTPTGFVSRLPMCSRHAWLLAPLVWVLGVLMHLLAYCSGHDGDQPAASS